MTTVDALKRNIIRTIGAAIDEATVIGVENSFIEMAEGVLHYAGDGGERYFRVVLVQSDGSDYFDLYDPTRGA